MSLDYLSIKVCFRFSFQFYFLQRYLFLQYFVCYLLIPMTDVYLCLIPTIIQQDATVVVKDHQIFVIVNFLCNIISSFIVFGCAIQTPQLPIVD